MRLRDKPIIEVSRTVPAPPERVWAVVTDITLPTAVAGELYDVEWLDGAAAVAVGARFRGYNRNEQLGEWATDSTITEVEAGRRWVYSVGQGDGDPWASWAFEVDPHSTGSVVRQWAKLEGGASPFAAFVAGNPAKEARIIDARLSVLRAGIEANLAEIAERVR